MASGSMSQRSRSSGQAMNGAGAVVAQVEHEEQPGAKGQRHESNIERIHNSIGAAPRVHGCTKRYGDGPGHCGSVAGSSPGQGTYIDCGPIPSRSMCRRPLIDVSLSLSLSLSNQ